MAHFEFYQGEDGQWYWRLKDGNNQIVAVGGEGYTRSEDAIRAITNVILTIAELDPDRETMIQKVIA